jgi:perosamine synthetase
MVVGASGGGSVMIPIFRPSMGEEEAMAVEEVLRSGWIGLGPKVEEFEHRFASYIGTRYAVALNSCTAALHLALKALEITSREVVTTPITFVSTAHAALYTGNIPVFADIEADTVNIDPSEIRRQVTGKTGAVIPVHYGGHPCEMDEIREIAWEHGLPVIEDAAHACGATYRGKRCGSLGTMGCFSFHAVKNLATGDGGMITTDDPAIYQKLMKLRWLGISRSTYERDNRGYVWDYDVEYVGFKDHMNDITAAIGIVQLEKLEGANAKRREIVHRYNEAFSDLGWLETPVERQYVRSSFHNYALKVKRGDRNRLIAHLADHGISAGVHYKPLYLHTSYRRLGIGGNCPVSDRVWQQLVILPLFPDLRDDEQEFIISRVKDFSP